MHFGEHTVGFERVRRFFRGARDGELCLMCGLGLELSGRFEWALTVVGFGGFFSDPVRWAFRVRDSTQVA